MLLRAKRILEDIDRAGSLMYIAGNCLLHLPIYTNEMLFDTKLAPYFLSLCHVPFEKWYHSTFYHCRLELTKRPDIHEEIKSTVKALHCPLRSYFEDTHWALAGLKKTYSRELKKEILLPIYSTSSELVFFSKENIKRLLELSDKMISDNELLFWGEYYERYLGLLAKSQGVLTLSEQSWIDYEKSILEEGFEVGTCRCGGAGACRECNPRMFIDDVVLD